jgi:hypothetical protein
MIYYDALHQRAQLQFVVYSNTSLELTRVCSLWLYS